MQVTFLHPKEFPSCGHEVTRQALPRDPSRVTMAEAVTANQTNADVTFVEVQSGLPACVEVSSAPMAAPSSRPLSASEGPRWWDRPLSRHTLHLSGSELASDVICLGGDHAPCTLHWGVPAISENSCGLSCICTNSEVFISRSCKSLWRPGTLCPQSRGGLGAWHWEEEEVLRLGHVDRTLP